MKNIHIIIFLLSVVVVSGYTVRYEIPIYDIDQILDYENFTENFILAPGYNITAFLIGNNSIWSRTGNDVILTNTGDNVNLTNNITAEFYKSQTGAGLSWNASMNTTTNVLSFTFIINPVVVS